MPIVLHKSNAVDEKSFAIAEKAEISMIHIENYINGKLTVPASGGYLENAEPATEKRIR